FRTNAQMDEALKVLRDTGKSIIEGRRANPTEKKDVLNTMIYGKDPKTGEAMRDELIVAQMTTFLVAGRQLFLTRDLTDAYRPRNHIGTALFCNHAASEEP